MEIFTKLYHMGTITGSANRMFEWGWGCKPKF